MRIEGGADVTTDDGTYYVRFALRSDGPNGMDAASYGMETIPANTTHTFFMWASYTWQGLGQHTLTGTLDRQRTIPPIDLNWITHNQKTSNYTLVLAP